MNWVQEIKDRDVVITDLIMQRDEVAAERDVLRGRVVMLEQHLANHDRLRTALEKAVGLLLTGARREVVALHCARALGGNEVAEPKV